MICNFPIKERRMDNFNGKSPGLWTFLESKSKGLGDSSIKNKGFTTIDIPGCLPQLCSLAPCSLGATAFGSLLVEASSFHSFVQSVSTSLLGPS